MKITHSFNLWRAPNVTLQDKYEQEVEVRLYNTLNQPYLEDLEPNTYNHSIFNEGMNRMSWRENGCNDPLHLFSLQTRPTCWKSIFVQLSIFLCPSFFFFTLSVITSFGLISLEVICWQISQIPASIYNKPHIIISHSMTLPSMPLPLWPHYRSMDTLGRWARGQWY